MSEKIISHAQLDRDLYKVDMSPGAVLDRRADAATTERFRKQEIDTAYERAKEEREREALFAGAMRAIERDGPPISPTAMFEAQQKEYQKDEQALQDAGRVDTLNAGLAREISKVTDEENGIDISKLNPNDLIRYKTALNPLLGEDASVYTKRMKEVFGTENYVETVAKLMDEGDIWTLRNTARRQPGDNPLADQLETYFARQEESEESQ